MLPPLNDDSVHYPLEQGWGVLQTGRQNLEVVEPFSRNKSRLSLILFQYRDLQIPTLQLQLRVEGIAL